MNQQDRQDMFQIARTALGQFNLHLFWKTMGLMVTSASSEEELNETADHLGKLQVAINYLGEELKRARSGATVAQKPVARTEPPRVISTQKPVEKQPSNRSKVAPTISRLVQMGQRDESSATPGDPMAEFREVLGSPTPEGAEEKKAYWSAARAAVSRLFASSIEPEVEDWKLLVGKMGESLYPLDVESDDRFFSLIPRNLLVELLLGKDGAGKTGGAIPSLIAGLKNTNDKMKGVHTRSGWVILRGLLELNAYYGGTAQSLWAALIAKEVTRLNGPPRLIEAFESVKAMPKSTTPKAAEKSDKKKSGEKTAAGGDKHLVSRKHFPDSKFTKVEKAVAATSTEVEEALAKARKEAANGAANRPFEALKGFKVSNGNGNNGSGKEAVEAVAQ